MKKSFRDLAIDDDEFQATLTDQESEISKDEGGETIVRPKLHTMPKG
jgi:hypothetical protein